VKGRKKNRYLRSKQRVWDGLASFGPDFVIPALPVVIFVVVVVVVVIVVDVVDVANDISVVVVVVVVEVLDFELQVEIEKSRDQVTCRIQLIYSST
jgi:hypothetical protein